MRDCALFAQMRHPGHAHLDDARIELFGRELGIDPVRSLLVGIYPAEAEGCTLDAQEIAAYPYAAGR